MRCRTTRRTADQRSPKWTADLRSGQSRASGMAARPSMGVVGDQVARISRPQLSCVRTTPGVLLARHEDRVNHGQHHGTVTGLRGRGARTAASSRRAVVRQHRRARAHCAAPDAGVTGRSSSTSPPRRPRGRWGDTRRERPTRGHAAVSSRPSGGVIRLAGLLGAACHRCVSSVWPR
jgi:hypothetical protein